MLIICIFVAVSSNKPKLAIFEKIANLPGALVDEKKLMNPNDTKALL